MEVGEFQLYRIGGFKGHRWYNKHLDRMRSKRDRCKKGARRYTRLTQVYKRISERKHNKQRDSLHKASHLLAHKVVERTVVIGDLSQKQMVTNAHKERNKHLKRWTTSGVSSPLCRCSHTLERQDQVHLTQREQEKLLLFVAAELARKRQGRGLKLNYPEAIAILSAEILEVPGYREKRLRDHVIRSDHFEARGCDGGDRRDDPRCPGRGNISRRY